MPGFALFILMLAPTLVALVFVTVAAGRAGRIARARLRRSGLLGAAALIRSSVELPLLSMAPTAAVRAALVVADALLTAFAAANWAGRTCAFRVGLALVVAGAALNAIPTIWSGGMPFSPAAASTAHVSAAEIADPVVGHVALTDEPGAVAALSDVLAAPWLSCAASLGDVVLLTGAAALAGGVLPRRRPPRRT